MATKVTDNDMSPENSPGEATKKMGTRRVNKKPMLIVIGLVAAFAAVMAYVANERANREETAKTEEKNTGSSSMYAESLASQAPTGFIPAAKPPKKAEPLIPMTGAPASASNGPTPAQPGQPMQPAEKPQQDPDALERERERLRRQMEAMLAKTGVDSEMQGRTGAGGTSREDMLKSIQSARNAAETSADPTARYNQQVAEISSGLSGQSSDSGMKSGMSQFGGGEQGSSRWTMKADREAPSTPFELRAGFVIPAVLISGINSELPGQILGQVSQNVYDTATGEHLLIPQGSRLVGTYSSNVQYGQSRVLVAWQRIIYPDGRAQDIGNMPGSDSAGYAGFNDQVNNHYLRIFASAMLLSGITAGITYSQDRGDNNSNGYQSDTAGDVLSQSVGQVLGTTIAQMMQKNINIAPTLEIRPGYQFNVTVVKDMPFDSPYKSFAY